MMLNNQPILKSKTKRIMYLIIIVNIGLIITGVIENTFIRCSFCYEVPFLNITDIQLGALGVSSSLLLAVLIYLSDRAMFRHLALFISLFISVFSTVMQVGRYVVLGGYCPWCLGATATAYILSGLLIYNFTIKPLVNGVLATMIQPLLEKYFKKY